MTETSLERLTRVLDLIPFIENHPGIPIDNLAREFGISVEQVLADLNLLFVCGLPGKLTMDMIDLAFDDGRVSIIDPQGLDTPRRLTRREIISLIAGLEMLLSTDFFDPSRRTRAMSLKEKFSSALNDSVVIHTGPNKVGTIHAEVILQAIREKKWLHFTYTSGVSDRVTERTVQPLNLTVEGQHTYLSALDIDLEELRNFRLDRMAALMIFDSEEPVTLLNPDLDQEVRLVIKDSARSFVEENPQIVVNSLRIKGGYEVTCKLHQTEWLIRRMLAYGEAINVLAPLALRVEIKQRAREILALYSEAEMPSAS